MTSSAECRCWRGRCRGWRPRGFVRGAFWALRGAYWRIEGRRVAAAGALAAPRAWAVPGAESLCTSSVFRNTLGGRPKGVGSLNGHSVWKESPPPWASPKPVANTRDCTRNALAPEDDDPRREPPPARFPSMMLFRRSATPQAPPDEAASRIVRATSLALRGACCRI